LPIVSDNATFFCKLIFQDTCRSQMPDSDQCKMVFPSANFHWLPTWRLGFVILNALKNPEDPNPSYRAAGSYRRKSKIFRDRSGEPDRVRQSGEHQGFGATFVMAKNMPAAKNSPPGRNSKCVLTSQNEGKKLCRKLLPTQAAANMYNLGNGTVSLPASPKMSGLQRHPRGCPACSDSFSAYQRLNLPTKPRRHSRGHPWLAAFAAAHPGGISDLHGFDHGLHAYPRLSRNHLGPTARTPPYRANRLAPSRYGF